MCRSIRCMCRFQKKLKLEILLWLVYRIFVALVLRFVCIVLSRLRSLGMDLSRIAGFVCFVAILFSCSCVPAQCFAQLLHTKVVVLLGTGCIWYTRTCAGSFVLLLLFEKARSHFNRTGIRNTLRWHETALDNS
jgi:hypothetical protein